MASAAEVAAMRRAIDLARRSSVPIGPNPRVGAVIIDADGAVIAEGFHRGAGTVHAEVDALQQAGERAKGATAVVSMEPCAHTGRTGPCVVALADAGIARVVFGQPDPNPRAAGGGLALDASGIEVEGGVLADEAERCNPVWSFSMRQQRPFVTWKFATTLDGRSAAADGTAQWITGAEARADVHRQRAVTDTVLVGTGTALADNPRLTVRDRDGNPLPRTHQPLRVVMGMRDLPADANVFDDTAPTLPLHTHDPAYALVELFRLERRHVWLEGGPTLAAAFLKAGLVDEIVAYVAPALLGAGHHAVADLGITSIGDTLRFDVVDCTRLGPDVRIVMKGSSSVHRNR